MTDSLEGLSVGDALGEHFFSWRHMAADLRSGWLPPAPWRWTDDTSMAATLADHLSRRRRVDQNRLAEEFGRDYHPTRGYGPAAGFLLASISYGGSWRTLSREAFGGTGSFGNGSAMRVAPLGAWYFDDLAAAADQARLSAEVTHPHPEGIAGAIAVACAAAYVAGERARAATPAPADVLAAALEHTPDSEVATRLRLATELLGTEAAAASLLLGNGSQISCQDTVPFCLWTAATWLSDYPEAVLTCVEAGGDVDTTCAIAGGIVGAFTGIGDRAGVRGVPQAWVDAREPLPGAGSRRR